MLILILAALALARLCFNALYSPVDVEVARPEFKSAAAGRKGVDRRLDPLGRIGNTVRLNRRNGGYGRDFHVSTVIANSV